MKNEGTVMTMYNEKCEIKSEGAWCYNSIISCLYTLLHKYNQQRAVLFSLAALTSNYVQIKNEKGNIPAS